MSWTGRPWIGAQSRTTYGGYGIGSSRRACLSPVRRNGARRVLRGRRRSNAPPLPDWRIWFYMLEAAGLSVQLVNARDVKNVPGRPKTDLLTELLQGVWGGCVRGGVGLARFAARDWRWRTAAGFGGAGGAG